MDYPPAYQDRPVLSSALAASMRKASGALGSFITASRKSRGSVNLPMAGTDALSAEAGVVASLAIRAANALTKSTGSMGEMLAS